MMTDVFKSGVSFWSLHSSREDENRMFSDLSLLGNYLDDFSTDRLGGAGSAYWINALVYLQTMEGIPFIYYGTEMGIESNGLMFCSFTHKLPATDYIIGLNEK
mmetsp:Transcript_29306/g.44147  ORF Transcript_29306/g.44147 Transcript_29306/m.44147 type:complete len:103 (+) Transcript_29306:760-1068(+)